MKQYEANLASQSKVTDQHEEAFSLENFSDSEDKVNKMQDSKAKNKPRLKKNLKKDGNKNPSEEEKLPESSRNNNFDNE